MLKIENQNSKVNTEMKWEKDFKPIRSSPKFPLPIFLPTLKFGPTIIIPELLELTALLELLWFGRSGIFVAEDLCGSRMLS